MLFSALVRIKCPVCHSEDVCHTEIARVENEVIGLDGSIVYLSGCTEVIQPERGTQQLVCRSCGCHFGDEYTFKIGAPCLMEDL